MRRVGRLGWSSQTTLRRPTLLEGRVIVSPDTLGQIRELIGSIVRFGEQDNDLGLRTIFRDEIVLGTRSFASKIDGDRDITTFHRPLETLPDFSVMSYRSCWSPSACFILSIVATVTIRCSDGIAEIAVLHAGVTGHGNDPTAASGKKPVSWLRPPVLPEPASSSDDMNASSSCLLRHQAGARPVRALPPPSHDTIARTCPPMSIGSRQYGGRRLHRFLASSAILPRVSER